MDFEEAEEEGIERERGEGGREKGGGREIGKLTYGQTGSKNIMQQTNYIYYNDIVKYNSVLINSYFCSCCCSNYHNCNSERSGKTKAKTETLGDRQMDRLKAKDRERGGRERKGGGKEEGQRQRWTGRRTVRQRQSMRQRYRQTDGRTMRQADRHSTCACKRVS